MNTDSSISAGGSWWKWTVLFVVTVGMFIGAYLLGQRSTKRLTYFSELVERTQGRKTYMIDLEVVCSNGKDVGRLQVDLNLTNGKLVVVRNDSKLEPNCAR